MAAWALGLDSRGPWAMVPVCRSPWTLSPLALYIVVFYRWGIPAKEDTGISLGHARTMILADPPEEQPCWSIFFVLGPV